MYYTMIGGGGGYLPRAVLLAMLCLTRPSYEEEPIQVVVIL